MSSTNWTTDNIPDQSARVVLITGANSGIGYEAAKALTAKGAEVILAVRDMAKGETAKAEILTHDHKAKVKVALIDLTSLQSVKAFAAKFTQEYQRLDLLINNAGIMIPPYSRTVDGFESQMGTNHLGHFALTAQLFDLLDKTPDSRIVNISSGAHNAGNLNFDDFHWEKRRYFAWRAYGDSKIANLYFTFELKRLLEKRGSAVKAVAAHPGYTATELQKTTFLKILNYLLAQPAHMGALPTLMAAVDPSINSGDYIGPSHFREMRGYPKMVSPNKLAQDRDIATKLWSVSEELTGVEFNI